MVEYVKLNVDKVLSKKQRVNLIIFTYVLNFNLLLFLFKDYDSLIVKGLLLLLLNGIIITIMTGQASIGSLNLWAIFFAIINFFHYGWNSFMFLFNLFIIISNILYLKYILKDLNVKET